VVTLNNKEENSQDFYLDFIQEFGIWIVRNRQKSPVLSLLIVYSERGKEAEVNMEVRPIRPLTSVCEIFMLGWSVLYCIVLYCPVKGGRIGLIPSLMANWRDGKI
jgi:hypothetical protein